MYMMHIFDDSLPSMLVSANMYGDSSRNTSAGIRPPMLLSVLLLSNISSHVLCVFLVIFFISGIAILWQKTLEIYIMVKVNPNVTAQYMYGVEFTFIP